MNFKSLFLLIQIFLTSIILAQTFEFQTNFQFDSSDTSQVYLLGDFNNWSPTANPMQFNGFVWKSSVNLSNGFHFYTFLVHDSNFVPDSLNPLIIDGKINEFISIITAGDPGLPKRFKAEIDLPGGSLPQLVFDNEPELIQIFNSALANLINFHYAELTGNNYFIKSRSPLIALPSAYLRHVFPVGRYLDSFYSINFDKSELPLTVQFALLPYVEFRYFQITGDDSRFAYVFPKLLENCSGLCQRINSFLAEPNKSILDFWGTQKILHSPVFLQSLEALYLQNLIWMAGILNNDNAASVLINNYIKLNKEINNLFWDEQKQFYGTDFNFAGMTTILAGVCPEDKIDLLLSKLTSSKIFNPAHQYLIASGLNRYFGNGDAVEIAFNSIQKIVNAYLDFMPSPELLNPAQRFDDDYNTFWRFYENDSAVPARSPISGFYSDQDDPLTSGPGFLSMLIENFMGIELAGNENVIRWKINLEGRHGIKNILFREKPVDLICEPTEKGFMFQINSRTNFEFEININGTIYKKNINIGFNYFVIE